MISFILQLTKKLHYKVFKAPKGYGQHQCVEELNEMYNKGKWDFLDSIDEMANYMITVGYVRYLAKSLGKKPKILDLGCGTGNLVDFMSIFPYEKYLGLDISDVAIERAKAKNFNNSEFQIAKFEEWESDEKFDFIVSTGAIHYAENPVEVLQKFSKFLTKDGLFIISLWRHGHNGVIWQNIEKHFEIVDTTLVTNHKQETWDIKVLKKK